MRHAEQFGHDLQRQRPGELAHQLAPPPVGEAVHELVGDLADARLPGLGAPQVEEAVEQRAVAACVLGRVGGDQRAGRRGSSGEASAHCSRHVVEVGRRSARRDDGRERLGAPDHVEDVGVASHQPDAIGLFPDRSRLSSQRGVEGVGVVDVAASRASSAPGSTCGCASVLTPPKVVVGWARRHRSAHR